MKYIYKILLILSLLWLSVWFADASVFQLGTWDQVKESSMDVSTLSNDPNQGIQTLAIRILGTIKVVLSSLVIVFLVYAGANMILAMGSDDEKISSSRNQIWYAAIGLLFINIPGTLYDVFYTRGWEINEFQMTNEDFNAEWNGGNIFLNDWIFQEVFYNDIVRFLQIAIFSLAILMIIVAGYNIITSRWRDEKITESRSKIIYSIVALFFVWFIEVLKRVVYTAKVDQATWLFSSITNLMLYFAVPVIIFFLFLAAIYYITSNGDEEKVKKAKTIVINTFLATLLLMALYTFLLDLIQL